MLHVSISIQLATDGDYRRETIDSETAGVLIAGNADSMQLHLGNRNTADLIENISGVKIPSAALRVANQTRINRLDVGDIILCVRLREGIDKRGKLEPDSVTFARIERIR